MAEPKTYTPSFDFTATDKGTRLNVQLQDISESTESLAEAISDIRRADGALQNGIVTRDSLAASIAGVFDADIAASAAAAGRAETAAERAENAADRIDLGALDAAVAATEADALLTAADRAQTGLDRVQTGADVTAAQTARTGAEAARAAASEITNLVWSPREFLKDGDAGVYLMPLDPVSLNLWTDTARTTPATAAGQRIASARLVDQAGSFLYAEQATLANRPYLGRYPEGGRRNLLLNSAAIGAVVGNPGTLPNAWGRSGGTIASEVVATGLDPDGHEYVDLRITGSPGTGGVVQLGGNTDTAVVAGNPFNWSVKVARVAGSAANINSVTLQMSWRDAGGAFLSQTTGSDDFKDDTSLAVRAMSANAPANANFVLPQIRLNCSGAVDITLRISAGQVEAGNARTGYQRVAFIAGGAPSRLDVTEAGKASIWYLLRSAAAVALPVTVPNYGTNATILRSIEGAISVAEGQTVGAGAFETLGADGSRLTALTVLSRAISDAEQVLSEAWLNRRRGVVPPASGGSQAQITGAVSLAQLGYTPASGDIRSLVAAAAALSPSGHVIIPYNAAPWVQGGQWTIDGLTVEWEIGARVAQDHAVVDGVRLLNAARLIRPYFTSTVYTLTTMAGLDQATAMAGYGHNKRAIRVEGDNCQILDVQMLEFMAGGIKATNHKGLKVTGLKARHLRSAEGFAAAINLGAQNFGPGVQFVTDAYVEVDTIEDCDRALEPEDGASNITFVAAPGILRRIWSRYYDIPANGIAQGFCISCHSHDYGVICQNIRYEGSWTCVDCVTPVFCDKASGSTDQLPQGFFVENVTIINTSAFPVSFANIGNRAQIFLQSHGADVTASFQHPDGAAVAQARVEVSEGRGNRISLPGPDIAAAIPWVTVAENAIRTSVHVVATNLSAQPSVPASAGDDHCINVRGPQTRVTGAFHNVQNRGIVRLGTTSFPATGSRVEADFIMPGSAGPNAAIRLNGCDACVIHGCSYTDAAGVSQLARAISGAIGNLIEGNQIDRAAGVSITLDSGANDNAVVGNLLGGTTISNGGTGNTVTPNY